MYIGLVSTRYPTIFKIGNGNMNVITLIPKISEIDRNDLFGHSQTLSPRSLRLTNERSLAVVTGVGQKRVLESLKIPKNGAGCEQSAAGPGPVQGSQIPEGGAILGHRGGDPALGRNRGGGEGPQGSPEEGGPARGGEGLALEEGSRVGGQGGGRGATVPGGGRGGWLPSDEGGSRAGGSGEEGQGEVEGAGRGGGGRERREEGAGGQVAGGEGGTEEEEVVQGRGVASGGGQVGRGGGQASEGEGKG